MRPSAGDDLPALMMAGQKGDDVMTWEEYKARGLVLALEQAEHLCEMSACEDIKIEPEQARKNASTVLSIILETAEFLKTVEVTCTSSK